jgi:hypothetical protein
LTEDGTVIQKAFISRKKGSCDRKVQEQTTNTGSVCDGKNAVLIPFVFASMTEFCHFTNRGRKR